MQLSEYQSVDLLTSGRINLLNFLSNHDTKGSYIGKKYTLSFKAKKPKNCSPY
jgi:hypothetical protein